MSETTRSRKGIWINLALLAAIAVVFIGSLAIGHAVFGSGEGEAFGGTDGAAADAIAESGYKPWFTSLFQPTGEIESGLFALQAALGAGVLGFALGWYRCKSKLTKSQ